jgi:hypothetical protein
MFLDAEAVKIGVASAIYCAVILPDLTPSINDLAI